MDLAGRTAAITVPPGGCPLRILRASFWLPASAWRRRRLFRHFRETTAARKPASARGILVPESRRLGFRVAGRGVRVSRAERSSYFPTALLRRDVSPNRRARWPMISTDLAHALQLRAALISSSQS